MKFDKSFLLVVGVGLAFAASGLRGILFPEGVTELMKESFLTQPLLHTIPSLVQIIAVHDILIAILVLSRIFHKYVITYVVIWMAIVIFTHISTFSIDNDLDALEHSIILLTALFLSLAAWKKGKVEKPSPVAQTTAMPTQTPVSSTSAPAPANQTIS